MVFTRKKMVPLKKDHKRWGLIDYQLKAKSKTEKVFLVAKRDYHFLELGNVNKADVQAQGVYNL